MLLKGTLGSLIGPVSLASWLPYMLCTPKLGLLKHWGQVSKDKTNKQIKPEIVS